MLPLCPELQGPNHFEHPLRLCKARTRQTKTFPRINYDIRPSSSQEQNSREHSLCVSQRRVLAEFSVTLSRGWRMNYDFPRSNRLAMSTVIGTHSTTPKLPPTPCMIAMPMLLELMIC